MSSTGSDKANVVAEQPAAAKAVEKKAIAPKVKKPKTAKSASHPPYFQMIKEALLALKEKGGSSPHAIAKYMEDNHKAVLPENFKKMLSLQLKNSASKGKLTKVKASYKLSESGKKEKAPAVAKKPTVAGKKPKKTKSKKPAAPVARATAEPKKTKSKKPAAPVARATAATTADRPKKTTKATKTAVVKKQAPAKKAKKMTPAKAKQPKSIKSPAAKKARKASV